ncbi:MAG: PASTA domain-containing protein, partial [Draconibacterium sp.]|nr:PASTA domain-containing protein [Draconibacterium sp.]
RVHGNVTTPLPNLIGYTIEEAQKAITDAMLNPGVLIYDETVQTAEDSINAKIWRQRPNPVLTKQINLGSSIDMWITVDQQKIDDAKNQQF